MEIVEELRLLLTSLTLMHEVSGRIMRVEFAKQLRRPPRPHPPGIAAGTPAGETRHKLYISNLAWKVRGSHLREFLSTNFNPISSKVVFDSPTGRSWGYGFVSFATKEEAEASTSSLNGKMRFLLVRGLGSMPSWSQSAPTDFFAGSLMTRSTSRKVKEVVSFSNSVLQFKIEHRSPISTWDTLLVSSCSRGVKGLELASRQLERKWKWKEVKRSTRIRCGCLLRGKEFLVLSHDASKFVLLTETVLMQWHI